MRETNSESGLTVLNTDRIENKRHTQIAVGVQVKSLRIPRKRRYLMTSGLPNPD